jgi:hypothetical protein
MMLSEQARRILRVRCADHTVAHCDRCDEEWFHEELKADLTGSVCRICWADLTPSIERHLFMCLLSWTHDEQVRAHATRTTVVPTRERRRCRR